MQHDVFGFIDAHAAHRGASLHEVARNLRLPVDGDGLAHQALQRDPMAPPLEADRHAIVHQTFLVQARGHTGTIENIDRALLEHTGANATEHVLGAAPLENHRVDALPQQQLPQEESRGTGADDDDLCSRAGLH